MKGQIRFPLKRPTGWFAAGREVACALQLLSDGTFKLFVWLCLNAERSQAVVSICQRLERISREPYPL